MFDQVDHPGAAPMAGIYIYLYMELGKTRFLTGWNQYETMVGPSSWVILGKCTIREPLHITLARN